MKNYDSSYNKIKNNCYCPDSCNNMIVGNNIDMNIQKNDCEVRADIIVEKIEVVRIWGIVKDCDGSPIPNAMVNLVKPINKNGLMEYEGVAYTLTDCCGFYQIEAPSTDCDSRYKILVSKSCLGNERILFNDPYKAMPTSQAQNQYPPKSPQNQCPPQNQYPPQTQQNQQSQTIPYSPQSNCNNQPMKYNSNIESRGNITYSTEPVHNQFYGEVVNKGNIFKKTE